MISPFTLAAGATLQWFESLFQQIAELFGLVYELLQVSGSSWHRIIEDQEVAWGRIATMAGIFLFPDDQMAGIALELAPQP